ncbi:MAG: EI24 domain-containing protein [Planctomycetes bacterium]|nr:EI24 domain-containing protein [Planctomycetota bacterium]
MNCTKERRDLLPLRPLLPLPRPRVLPPPARPLEILRRGPRHQRRPLRRPHDPLHPLPRRTRRWLLTGAVAVAGLFLFTIVGNVLASPFLDAMTERILAELGETLPPSRGAGRALLRALGNQSLKLLFFGAIQAALLLLHLIPGVGSVLHPLLSAFVGVLFLGFEYLDYPLDARRVPVPGRFGWMLKNLGATLGFGVVLFPVLLVPFVGYVSLPLAVAGAALLAHNIDSPQGRM